MTEYSGNGWSVIADTFLKTWNVGGRTLPLRRGPAGYVLAHFATRFNQDIEPLLPSYDDWGWNPRKVAGTDVWSNHASGTAVDLNATTHPQGTQGTFPPEQVDKIHRIINDRYDGLLRWGADWTRPDDMHFEINGVYSQIDALATKLVDTPIGLVLARDN